MGISQHHRAKAGEYLDLFMEGGTLTLDDGTLVSGSTLLDLAAVHATLSLHKD